MLQASYEQVALLIVGNQLEKAGLRLAVVFRAALE